MYAQPTLCSDTHHSCIFAVSTIVNSNTEMGAVSQACLTPSAGHVVIVDGTTALAKEGSCKCRCGSAVTELTAHHIGISNVPKVIAHSAPFSIVVHFNTTLICSGTAHQADITFTYS